MSHPRAYLGEPEIFAAQNRYNVPINTSLSSNDLPNPTNADPSAIQLLYNASSRHYCCCLLTSLPPNNLPPFVVTGIATAMASRRHQLPSPAGILLHRRLQKCRTSYAHTLRTTLRLSIFNLFSTVIEKSSLFHVPVTRSTSSPLHFVYASQHPSLCHGLLCGALHLL